MVIRPATPSEEISQSWTVDIEDLGPRLRDAFVIGGTRTMQQDVTYGRRTTRRRPRQSPLARVVYDEPRRAAAPHQTVCLYLLATLESLTETLDEADLGCRTVELHPHSRLVAAGCGNPEVLGDDTDLVRTAYREELGAE